jgi:hypothetical protein
MLMSAQQSRNLPGPLEQAEAEYRGSVARLPPVTPQMLAQRAGHFAAGVQLSLDEPQAMRRLHQATGSLHGATTLTALLPRVLDGALSLTGADFGNVQLLDPATGSLRIVAESGFDPGFLDYFAVVDDGHSACGRAAREHAQAVIADVAADPGFTPHRGIAAASGFRAVQSTPLADHAGRLVGMVSTHFRRPHRPADLDLRITALFADFVGQAIAWHLGTPGTDGLVDPVGRAMISALLGPGDGHLADEVALPGPDAGGGSRERGPIHVAPFAADTMAEFAAYIVNRLFSVGLSLESAHSIVGKGPAAIRVAAAVEEVDLMIRDIRTRMFSLAADPAALMKERAAQTARALKVAAIDAAALLGQRADLATDSGQTDYQAEIDRWRAFADQAEQMARCWNQLP